MPSKAMQRAPDTLSQTFTALGDPTRRAILQRLQTGPLAVGELSRPFALSAPAITRHLKVLERAGLISRTKERQRRICTLRQDRLAEATEWLERMRQDWNRQFDALDALLQERMNHE